MSAALGAHFTLRLLFQSMRTCRPVSGFSDGSSNEGALAICRSNVPYLLLNFVSIKRIEDFESLLSIEVSEHKLSELNERSGDLALNS